MHHRFNPVFSDRRRLRNGWWIAIFVTVLFISLGTIVTLTRHQDIGIYQEAVVLVGATWLVQGLRRKPLTDVTGRFDRNWLTQLCIGAGVGTLLLLPTIGVLVATGHLTSKYIGFSATFPRWTMFYLSTSIAEELLFRGFIFRRFIDGLGFWQAQAICASMFLLAHLGNPGLNGVPMVIGSLNLIVFSLTMGYVAFKTGSLATPIGFHWAADLMQGGVLGLGTSGLFAGQGLFKTSLSGPAWLTGGAFGLEGGFPDLVVTATVLMVVYSASNSACLPNGWMSVIARISRPVSDTPRGDA